MNEEVMKDVVMKTEALLGALDLAGKTLGLDEKKELANLVHKPVGLRDTASFNLAIDMPSKTHIKQIRRDLADSISAEKWKDGFIFAMQLVMMVGAV